MSHHSGDRTCPQSFINPLLSAGGAGCEPSLGAVWLLLPGAGTPREAEPQRFRCWSRWGSLSAWELLLLRCCHSCRAPSAPVPCSSTWSSWAGQGAALAWGSQCQQCPLKSSVCFTSISLCRATLGARAQSCGEAPSHLHQGLPALPAALLGHPGLPLEPGFHRGFHTLPFSIQLDPTAGQFSWQGLESALGPNPGFVPQRATELPEIVQRWCPGLWG